MMNFIKVIKIIIGAGSAGLATGVGAEILTNPDYAVILLNKITGTSSKLMLLLPLVGTILMYFKNDKTINSQDNINKPKWKSFILIGLLIFLDLFYASLIWLKENAKGIIIDNGYLKITKKSSLEDKEAFIQSLNNNLPCFKNLNANQYETRLDILNELEKRLNTTYQEPWPQPFYKINQVYVDNSFYINLMFGLVAIGAMIYIYYNRNKIYDYAIHLGESLKEVVKNQWELGKINQTLMENDINLANLVKKLEYEITVLKYDSPSQNLIAEAKKALELTNKMAEKVSSLEINGDDIRRELDECCLILREILGAL